MFQTNNIFKKAWKAVKNAFTGNFTDKQMDIVYKAIESDHLRHQLEFANETAKFESEIKRLETEKQTLKKQLDATNLYAENAVAEKEKEVGILNSQLASKNQELFSLEKEKKDLETTTDILKAQIKSIMNDLETERREKELLQADMKGLATAYLEIKKNPLIQSILSKIRPFSPSSKTAKSFSL